MKNLTLTRTEVGREVEKTNLTNIHKGKEIVESCVHLTRTGYLENLTFTEYNKSKKQSERLSCLVNLFKWFAEQGLEGMVKTKLTKTCKRKWRAMNKHALRENGT